MEQKDPQPKSKGAGCPYSQLAQQERESYVRAQDGPAADPVPPACIHATKGLSTQVLSHF